MGGTSRIFAASLTLTLSYSEQPLNPIIVMDDRLLQPEDCLRLFLRAPSEADQAWLLARLVPGQAEEIARRIIRRAVRRDFDAGNMRHELAEDLLHETYSKLIQALWRMKAVGRGDHEAIRSYERWVA